MEEQIDEYSSLSSTEEKLWTFGLFLGYPIALTIAMIMIFVLLRHRKSSKNNENKYYIYAINTAIISEIGTIGITLWAMFFLNDLLVSWNYNNNIATSFDSVLHIFFCTSKLFFYFSFTFHVHSILNQILSLKFKLFMIIASISFIILLITLIIDDSTTYSTKEIGITSEHNIYFISYLGHDGAMIAHICVGLLSFIDMVYFIVLCYVYISQLKKLNKFSGSGIKGLILMIISSTVFLMSAISVAGNTSVKYLFTAITIITDDICLFLMFKCGDEIYKDLCGYLCANCCGKCIYGSSYTKLKQSNDDKDDDTNEDGDTDALL